MAARLLNTIGVNIKKLYVDILIAMGEDANSYKEDFHSKTKKGKTSTQTFAPDAVEMNVRVDGRKKLYPMEKMDEAGFFAVLLPGRKKVSYTFVKEDVYGKKTEYKDIYSYGRHECMQALLKISQNGKSEYNINKFMTGNAQDAYKYMGSHEAVVDGISGMIFGIWAPDARRVSVIGAFNKWDGRVFQMEKDYDT